MCRNKHMNDIFVGVPAWEAGLACRSTTSVTFGINLRKCDANIDEAFDTVLTNFKLHKGKIYENKIISLNSLVPSSIYSV